MPRLAFPRSLLAAAVLGLTLPERAAASPPLGGSLAEEAKSVVTSGLNLIKRVLRLDQGTPVVSHAVGVSAREASLELELAGGRSRSVSLSRGRLYLDGAAVARYAPGGPLERAWRQLLAEAAGFDTPGVVGALLAFRPTAAAAGPDAEALDVLVAFAADFSAEAPGSQHRASATGSAGQADSAARPSRIVAIRLGDLERLDAVGDRLERLEGIGSDVAEAVRESPMHLGDVTIAAGRVIATDLVVYQGTADVYGEVHGHVVALFGDVVVHDGAVVRGHAVALDGTVQAAGGDVRGEIRTLSADELAGESEAAPARARRPPRQLSALERVSTSALNVVAVFAALAMLGFGAVFFGRRYLEIIADTASHSFGRSLVVGMLGQLLVLPTFAMLIVGLVFTVVGILLLPFAAVAYVVAAALAALAGYLAVAHAVGETFTRRRMAHGAFVRAPNAYGYLFTGLVGLLGLWALAALAGWLGPVAILFKIAALLVTWVAATVGFGAVLLSRGGLRETFAGRHFGEMSDEYLWATPPATPTAGRMAKD